MLSTDSVHFSPSSDENDANESYYTVGVDVVHSPTRKNFPSLSNDNNRNFLEEVPEIIGPPTEYASPSQTSIPTPSPYWLCRFDIDKAVMSNTEFTRLQDPRLTVSRHSNVPFGF